MSGGASAAVSDWLTGSPREHGLDEAALRELEARVKEQMPKLLSALVARHGNLVYERYWNGADRDTQMNVRSVTKSFTGTLIGIAIGEGRISGVTAPAASFFTREELPRELDERKAATTLEHLLTMTSGFYWVTGNKLGERHLNRMHESRDWARFIWRLPVMESGRGQFQYRSPDSHLLSVILTRACGCSAMEYAQDRLFRPLGLGPLEWPADPQGNSAGHVFMQLKARDMLKLGQLYLQRGRWEGRQLVPESYIRHATAAQTSGHPGYGAYGYQWWNATYDGVRYYFAQGHGGQYIFVVPKLELVVVFTGDPSVSRWKSPRVLFEQLLLPAARQG